MACSSTQLPPLGAGGPEPKKAEDETQIWRDAEQLEQRIDKSPARYQDPELDAYLTAVARKLLPTGSGVDPRVKVIRNPLLNAFALPNGAIYVHSGILARMENEAQLSAVLGHELAHITHRHTVRQMRASQNDYTLVQIFQIILPGLEPVTQQLGSLWFLASTSGYSRELETEADMHGLRAMVRAGYDPRQAPMVMELFRQDRGERDVKEPYFFGTHPRLEERIANYRKLIDTESTAGPRDAGRTTNAEEFQRRIDPLVLDNAVLDIDLGRLKIARTAIGHHLERHPQASRAHFLMGEVHRRSGSEPQHIEAAMAEYHEAARADPNSGSPHRELGFLYRAQGASDQARAEFERYLALSPAAADALIVQGYVKEMSPP